MSQLVMAILPLILWFAWKKDMIDDKTTNIWFKYAWKGLWIGYLIAYALPSLFWFFTFIDNKGIQLAYLVLWILFGGLAGAYMLVSSIVYFFVAIGKYEGGKGLSLTELWITLVIYLIISGVNIWLTQRFAWHSILYMVASDV